MISKKRCAEIQTELNEVQKGCTARVYSIEEIQQIIEAVEMEIKKFPKWMYQYLTYKETKAATIHYSGIPHATYITITFNKNGTVKNVKISREFAKHQQYGGYIKKFVLDEQALLDYFDMEQLSSKLSRYLYHSLGFTSSGYRNIN